MKYYYKNGVKDSAEIEYFPSGNLKSLRSWDMGNPNGDYKKYYDGLRDKYIMITNVDTFEIDEPMKMEHSVYNFAGEISFLRKYDKEGNLIEEKGSPILLTRAQGDEIPRNENYWIQYYLATPEWVHREFVVNIIDMRGNIIESLPQVIVKEKSAVFFENRFEKVGKFRIDGISKYTDELFDNIKYDTSSIELKVVLRKSS